VFTARPGHVLDVEPRQAAYLADRHGWIIIGHAGRSSERPASINGLPLALGFPFIDLDLGRTLIWDGQTFRDPATGEAM